MLIDHCVIEINMQAMTFILLSSKSSLNKSSTTLVHVLMICTSGEVLD